MIEDRRSLRGGKAMLPEKPIFFIDLWLVSLGLVDVSMLGEVVALFIQIVQVVGELELGAETVGLCKGFVVLQRHPNGLLDLVITDLQVFKLIWGDSHQAGEVVVVWSIDIGRKLAKPKDMRELWLDSNLLEDLSLGTLLDALSEIRSSPWNSKPAFEFSLLKLKLTLFYSMSRMLLSWMSTPPQPTWNIE